MLAREWCRSPQATRAFTAWQRELKGFLARNGEPVCILMISVGLTRSAAKLLPSNGTSTIRNIALLAQTVRHDGSSRAPSIHTTAIDIQRESSVPISI